MFWFIMAPSWNDEPSGSVDATLSARRGAHVERAVDGVPALLNAADGAVDPRLRRRAAKAERRRRRRAGVGGGARRVGAGGAEVEEDARPLHRHPELGVA